jgi:hypothetical protein
MFLRTRVSSATLALGLAAVGLASVSCANRITLSPERVVLEFDAFSLFLDGARTADEAIHVVSGDLRIEQSKELPGNRFSVIGTGDFTAWGVRCSYVPGVLRCGGNLVDISKGGVVIRKTGRIETSYVLPLIAR